jgi:hypothetical protein
LIFFFTILDIRFFPSQFFALPAALKYESDQKQFWIMCTVKVMAESDLIYDRNPWWRDGQTKLYTKTSSLT